MSASSITPSSKPKSPKTKPGALNPEYYATIPDLPMPPFMKEWSLNHKGNPNVTCGFVTRSMEHTNLKVQHGNKPEALSTTPSTSYTLNPKPYKPYILEDTNIVAYNATISACEKASRWQDALQLFEAGLGFRV